MRSRLDKLWEFINNYLEVDYGYLPKSDMADEDDSRVDDYIQEIKHDFSSMIERGDIKPSVINDCIEVLKELDNI